MARRRVLVIEDERLLGEALCEILADDHDVELATTVARAVQRLRDDAGFEVILCDVQLPDGTAVDIYESYCKVWPDRGHRFLFVTGGTNDPGIRALLAQQHRVLRKPFDLDTLPALIEAHASVRIG